VHQERVSINDPTPFRNSKIALYSYQRGEWIKVEGDLPCRATSTSRNVPDLSEFSHIDEKLIYPYGYESVPDGVYSLRLVDWKDGANKAFSISDWGRDDGVISLTRAQEIKLIEIAPSVNGSAESRQLGVANSAWNKRESYLHPTYTEKWSHGDSRGCLNLYKPAVAEPNVTYDWDRLCIWLNSHRVPVGQLALVVVDVKKLGGNFELPDTLAKKFYLDFAPLVSLRTEDL
jgi:hypothetical protein